MFSKLTKIDIENEFSTVKASPSTSTQVLKGADFSEVFQILLSLYSYYFTASLSLLQRRLWLFDNPWVCTYTFYIFFYRVICLILIIFFPNVLIFWLIKLYLNYFFVRRNRYFQFKVCPKCLDELCGCEWTMKNRINDR